MMILQGLRNMSPERHGMDISLTVWMPEIFTTNKMKNPVQLKSIIKLEDNIDRDNINFTSEYKVRTLIKRRRNTIYIMLVTMGDHEPGAISKCWITNSDSHLW